MSVSFWTVNVSITAWRPSFLLEGLTPARQRGSGGDGRLMWCHLVAAVWIAFYKSCCWAAVKWVPSWWPKRKSSDTHIILIFLNNMGNCFKYLCNSNPHTLISIENEILPSLKSGPMQVKSSAMGKSVVSAWDIFGKGSGRHNILATWYFSRVFPSLSLCLLLQNRPYRDFYPQEHIQVMIWFPACAWYMKILP